MDTRDFEYFLKKLTGDLYHYRNCNLYFGGDCCGIKQEYHKVANEVDVLLQQSICPHNRTESYGTECVTIRCKDCNAEWYDSY